MEISAQQEAQRRGISPLATPGVRLTPQAAQEDGRKRLRAPARNPLTW